MHLFLRIVLSVHEEVVQSLHSLRGLWPPFGNLWLRSQGRGRDSDAHRAQVGNTNEQHGQDIKKRNVFPSMSFLKCETL